ncbi:MAG: hypothetical protein EZS28_038728, partial [Streblomastix strix]
MGLAGHNGRRGTGFGVSIGVKCGGGGTGLINHYDRCMQGNLRGQMRYETVRTKRNDGNAKQINKNSYKDNQTKGLCYLAGSSEGISSFERERGLEEIYQFHVQRACVPLCKPTFWLELMTNAFLQGDQANSQSDWSKVLRQSGTINGLCTDLIIGKETIREQHCSENSIHEGAEQEDVAIQIQGNTNYRLPIPWLEVEYLFEDNTHSSGQEKVIEIKDEKM